MPSSSSKSIFNPKLFSSVIVDSLSSESSDLLCVRFLFFFEAVVHVFGLPREALIFPNANCFTLNNSDVVRIFEKLYLCSLSLSSAFVFIEYSFLGHSSCEIFANKSM